MDKVDRQELVELMKLVDHIKQRAVLGVDQGRSARKKDLRTKVTAGAYALKSALEQVEMEASR